MKNDAIDHPPVTIKDISALLHISTGTVHRALHGKKGVGKELREKILAVAKERGYVPNEAAAALKRRKKRIVLIFPAREAANRFFYTSVWDGLMAFEKRMFNYNVELVTLDADQNPGQSLMEAYHRYHGEIDGILAAGAFDEQTVSNLKSLIPKGIPLAVSTTEIENALVNVVADFYATGQLAAELLAAQLPPPAKILVLAGKENISSHALTTQGFCEYFQQHSIQLSPICLYGYDESKNEALREKILATLQQEEQIKGLFCVNARGSVLLSNILRESTVKGTYRFVGSDLFAENIQSMQDGIMHHIIFKNPFQQSNEATRALLDFILHGQAPANSRIVVESNVIFQSNLPMYVQRMKTNSL